ncbi:S10 family peptidase [Stakelama sediminis]|uniref:Carboxypeptidase C (Cathepsin A) n=1 Tax=Stakelama sediminis TaxID=463200 RepID=A0A840YX40_9SPHN|nr:peptidase S10 [Stakelama sediminis]MBB5718228.1 carboxypeptidase C (cathepsin A) [Stakelama sediminis]
MKGFRLALLGSAMAMAIAIPAQGEAKDTPPPAKHDEAHADGPPSLFKPHSVTSNGTVTVGGQRIDYRAEAGTIVVHPKGWDDSDWRSKSPKDLADKSNASPEASMFYVAYFKNGAPSPDRPITFLYNGGPGSSTVWLHMGAFGPRRVVTKDDSHTPAAPYSVVNNSDSLLDASDLVFIDAPGTGFSRIAGKDKEKAFYGIDADAHAFSEFVKAFLTKYNRWNSPKYLFGESYGTPRSAVLINDLTTDDDIDFNGVILLSQILDFHLFAGLQAGNPGAVEGYVVQVPTYAATAWYHNLVPGGRPAELEPFLKQAEQFATTEYAAALAQGSEIDPATKQAVAKKLAYFSGLPVDYILKADLRVDGPEYSKELQQARGLTTGRLDTRFSGPDMDPLSKDAEYDPQSAALSSAYVSAFNQYTRNSLHYGEHQAYKPSINVFQYWDWKHDAPGVPSIPAMGSSVMPDLATAMKYDPQLKVMVNGGYYDLATPFYQGWYEMHHLPIPDSLRGNIEYHYYQSGHMVYAHAESLKKLHDNVVAFIRKTDNLNN